MFEGIFVIYDDFYDAKMGPGNEIGVSLWEGRPDEPHTEQEGTRFPIALTAGFSGWLKGS